MAMLSFNSNHYFNFNKLERSFKCGSTQNRYDMATPMDQDDPIGSSAPHAGRLSVMDIIQASKATTSSPYVTTRAVPHALSILLTSCTAQMQGNLDPACPASPNLWTKHGLR